MSVQAADRRRGCGWAGVAGPFGVGLPFLLLACWSDRVGAADPAGHGGGGLAARYACATTGWSPRWRWSATSSTRSPSGWSGPRWRFWLLWPGAPARGLDALTTWGAALPGSGSAGRRPGPARPRGRGRDRSRPVLSVRARARLDGRLRRPLLWLGYLLPRAWRYVAWVAGGLVVAMVGFAGSARRAHLTDVTAGWVLGIGWLTATAAVLEAWRRTWAAAVAGR